MQLAFVDGPGHLECFLYSLDVNFLGWLRR